MVGNEEEWVGWCCFRMRFGWLVLVGEAGGGRAEFVVDSDSPTLREEDWLLALAVIIGYACHF